LNELVNHLLNSSLEDVAKEAVKIRTAVYGTNITYSPKIFIPLTKLCRDNCKYCTFAKPPKRLDKPYLEMDEIIELAEKGAQLGCHEALFTLGEKPEYRYQTARDFLDKLGFNDTISYLYAAAKNVTEKTGLLVHSNAGAISYNELEMLRRVCPSQGMMLESVNPKLSAHLRSPDKLPSRRIETLVSAGKLQIPFTTGLLVGIGDTRVDRINGLLEIKRIHEQYGHIQEVIIQNFLPKKDTAMRNYPPCPVDEHLITIAFARIILPAEIHIQAPPNLADNIEDLLDAGIDDFGGISPLTIDHVNPENAWPDISRLKESLLKKGYELVPRLTVYPEFNSNKWISTELYHHVQIASDSNGLARNCNWSPGLKDEPPILIPNEKLYIKIPVKSKISEAVDAALSGQELDRDQIVSLFSARGNNFHLVCEAADYMREQIVGPQVTWVFNRNINYTNICTYKCRFCAFSKGPLSLNLRGDPYMLTNEEIVSRAIEAYEMGATEVCLQGGIHPDFDGRYYLNVVKDINKHVPGIHIHAFSALEIFAGATRLGISIEDYLKELKDAGLKSLPGTAAEILDDEIRKILCPDKISTNEWLEVHETAHKIGLYSNVTIMFGTFESPISWAKHIEVTRDLAKRTGGFTEFVPLPFVHMGSPIYLKKLTRKGPTFREVVLMHAVGRLSYGSYIPNVQASWVKLGINGVSQVLRAGANDLGGTLIDENISRAAGADHGQFVDPQAFQNLVNALPGRHLSQRTTLYKIISNALI
jgi:FO synthase